MFDVSINTPPIVQTEGYTNFDINEWDMQGLWETLNKLNQQGIKYQVNGQLAFNDHINMLVNKFSTLTKVGQQITTDFYEPIKGKCYADDGWRYLKHRGPDMGTNLYNNHMICKKYATDNNYNTFGLQYGYECWAGNTNNNMVTTEGRQLIPKSNITDCNRGGFDPMTGGPWTMTIYKKSSKELKTIYNYEDIIRQFVKSGYTNDADVIRANNLNGPSVSQFTTMEGFIEGATTTSPKPTSNYGVPDTVNFASNANKITITNNAGNRVDILTNNIIDKIVNNGYYVEVSELNNFINMFSSTGKNLDDIDIYIKTNISFGIKYDSLYKKMVGKLSEVSNQQNQYADPIQLIANLKQIGVSNVNGILDATGTNDGWFIKTVKSYGLVNYKLQLLPSSTPNYTVDSIISKLQQVKGTIQTLGDMPSGDHAFEHFFISFSQGYGVNGASFFNDIYPIYSDKELQIYNYSPLDQKKDPLEDALYRIYAFSGTSLIEGFKLLKQFLGKDSLNMSFNDYVRFLDALNSRIKYSCGIVRLWNDFKKYYNDVAIDKSNVTPTPTTPKIVPKTLLNMIDEINGSSTGSTYFNTTHDFCVYLKIITEHGYTLSRLKEDVRIGQGYVYFLESHSQQGFSDMNNESITTPPNKSQFDIFNYFVDGVNALFGKKEGLTNTTTPKKMTDADNIILIKFGINDFNVKLKSAEDTLRKYGVKEVSDDSEWNNIVKVIDKLTKLSITFDNLDEFVELMQKFGADRISKWYKVLDRLTDVKIKGYPNIKEFILLIMDFGVRYDTNFNHFIDVFVNFKADLSSSLDPIKTFIGDMKYVGYRYDQNQSDVDNITIYFTKCRYTLDTYSSGGSVVSGSTGYSEEKCKTNPSILPKFGLPRLIVRSFYKYKLPHFSNILYDIRTPSLLNDLPFCDIIDSMQQAYMITEKDVKSYNDATANFIPNTELVVPFFYNTEFFQIVNNFGSYSNDYKKIVTLMRDIANGMDRYSITLKDVSESINDYKLYLSLAKTIRTFPIICFQTLSYRIIKECNNTKCSDIIKDYSKYVNPDLSFSKAKEANISNNFRPSKPIL